MTFHNISLDGDTDETAVVDIPGPDVPEDPEDPDMLVLGFQELDLSTGALLYSSETTREEAWCTAVFAGLGEKAVLYEKVRSTRSWLPPRPPRWWSRPARRALLLTSDGAVPP